MQQQKRMINECNMKGLWLHDGDDGGDDNDLDDDDEQGFED